MNRRNFFHSVFGVLAGLIGLKLPIAQRKPCEFNKDLYCTKDDVDGCRYLDYLVMCEDHEWESPTSTANVFSHHWLVTCNAQGEFYTWDRTWTNEPDLYTWKDGEPV